MREIAGVGGGGWVGLGGPPPPLFDQPQFFSATLCEWIHKMLTLDPPHNCFLDLPLEGGREGGMEGIMYGCIHVGRCKYGCNSHCILCASQFLDT